MAYIVHVEDSDHAQIEQVLSLVSVFNRAVQNYMHQSGVTYDSLNSARTAQDNQEFTDVTTSYQMLACVGRHCLTMEEARQNAESIAIQNVLVMKMKENFIRVVARVVPQENLAALVSPELATEENAALLEKYKVTGVAALVRKAIPA